MKQNCDYSNSFIPDAIRIWNSMSQQLIDCSIVRVEVVFMRSLHSYIMLNWYCFISGYSLNSWVLLKARLT